MPATATLLALVTLTLWSFLAFLVAELQAVPPFLLAGLALTLSGLLSLPRWRAWRVPRRTFAAGVYGLFGYHLLFFLAFRYAPAVEANLLNYLWPLLIVLLTPRFLPGYRLRARSLLGAALGLAGVALIVGGGGVQPDLRALPGYLLAGSAALVWATYSLLTKRLPAFPTAAVGGFCLASGLLALGSSALLGEHMPWGTLSLRQWGYLALLGAGPMGMAFYTWDAALKRGDPRRIGALAYLTPLLSTLILHLWGRRPLTNLSLAAMLLIVGGAALGGRAEKA